MLSVPGDGDSGIAIRAALAGARRKCREIQCPGFAVLELKAGRGGRAGVAGGESLKKRGEYSDLRSYHVGSPAAIANGNESVHTRRVEGVVFKVLHSIKHLAANFWKDKGKEGVWLESWFGRERDAFQIAIMQNRWG